VLLTPHFTLEEMTLSQTAERNGIDNTPTPGIIETLRVTCEGFEEVRALLGCALIISSGYRCAALNKAVGGVDTSAHVFGYAADFIAPAFGPPIKIAQAILDSAIKFDQVIMEYTWVHLSFDPRLRRIPLTLMKTGGYSYGLPKP
jgi:hypothetical protein